MSSANFIAAAGKGNRKPVILLAVESRDALKDEVAVLSHWQASKSITNIDVSQFPVKLVLALQKAKVNVNSTLTTTGASRPDQNLYSAVSASYSPNTSKVQFSYRIYFPHNPDDWTGGGSYATSVTVEMQGSKDNGPWQALGSPITHNYPGWFWGRYYSPLYDIERGNWQFRIKVISRTVDGNRELGQSLGYTTVTFLSHIDSYDAGSGTIQTKTLDLGKIPTINSRIEIDDTIPSGCTITYTARGSNDGATWSNIGTVIDGQSIPPYRYYDVTATLAALSGSVQTPSLAQVRIIGGDSQYDYFSTHKDMPVLGAKPYILESGVSSLTSKIDLLKPATTGEITAKLYWRKKTSDMIAAGKLKNKAVICKLGFQELPEADYDLYFTGTWYDYQGDHEKGVLTVKTRDVWKKFKAKIPEETSDSSGAITTVPLEWKNANIIQAMLDIIDAIGVPDRYIDRPAFIALRDGDRSSSVKDQKGNPIWNVSRTISKPTEAQQLLNELAVSAGAFLYPLPDGRMTIKLYDTAISGSAAAVLDAKKIKFGTIDGGQKELKTRHSVYYGLVPGKEGGSRDDYANVYISINADAEISWNETKEEEWLDKWGISTYAVQSLARRLDSWFANPKITVKAENVPPRYMNINPGDVVEVDNLQLPAPEENWPGLSNKVKFLVMSKTLDPGKMTLSFELFQCGAINYSAKAIPEYPSYGLFPPVQNLTVAEQIAKRPDGTIDDLLSVDFDTPADFHFGSAEVWYNNGDQPVTSGTFTRTSGAYELDGSPVASGTPRYEVGKSGQALLVEEGTVNALSSQQARFTSGWTLAAANGDEGKNSLTLNAGGEEKGIYSTTQAIAGWADMRVSLSSASMQGQTYTFSIGEMVVSGLTTGRVSLWIEDYDGTTYSANSFPITANGTYQNVSVTRTFRNPITVAWLGIRLEGANAGASVTLRRAQWEQKSYRTSWTDGTRNAETFVLNPAGIASLQQGTVELDFYVDGDAGASTCKANHWLFALAQTGSASPYPNVLGIKCAPGTPGYWQAWCHDSNGQSSDVSWQQQLSRGWHFFAIVWSPYEFSFWIDGVKRGSVAYPSLPTVLPTTAYIGSWATSGLQSNGLFDNIRISNRARSDEEIVADHATGTTLPRSGEAIYELDFNDSLVLKKLKSTNWTLAGSVTQGGPATHRTFQFPVQELKTYEVAVLTINASGMRMPIAEAPKTSIFTFGKTAPPADVPNFGHEVKDFVRLTWDHVPDVDLAGYEIRLGPTWDSGTVLVSKYMGNSFLWVPTQSGNLTFHIKAEDTSVRYGTNRGNYSINPSSLTITVAPPGQVQTITPEIIDNNVLLKWSAAPQGTFPIDHYEIRKGLTFAAAETIGQLKGTFSTVFESRSGTYKYWVVAIDKVGLRGAENGVYATVAQPPDYVLKSSVKLTWDGTRVNAYKDGTSLVAPINTAENFQQHFDSNSWLSPQDQVNAGYPAYIQPGLTTGNYEEIIDYGAIFGGTKITLDLTKKPIAGTVTVSPVVAVSPDGTTWTTYAGQYEVYASNFRYVKVSLSFASTNKGALAITQAMVTLDVKQKTLSGRVNVTDTAGDGTLVTFADYGVTFIDVDSISTEAPFTNDLTKDPISARYNFVDAPNPIFMKILCWDKNGNRVAVNNVSFTVRGT